MTSIRDRNRYVKTYSPVRVPPSYELTGGAGGSGNTVFLGTKNSHGFQRFDLIFKNSSGEWQLSNAADPENSDVDAIVTEVVNANNFEYQVPWSTIESAHFSGKAAGDIYYLDPASPGKITDVEPVTVGKVSKPVLKFITAQIAIFLGFRGIEILETPETQVNKVKDTARVATTSPLPTCTYDENVLTADAFGDINDTGVDGVTDLIVGDRILVKDEVDATTNGIYRLTDIGDIDSPWVMVRTDDANVDTEVIRGIFLPINEGVSNGEKSFILITPDPISLGSSNIEFVELGSGSGSPGAQGAQGFQGATGGAQGAQGLTGDQGAQGAQGAAGSGAQGAQGFQGAVGSTGDQGVQGAAGSGAQGAQGFQGAVGSTGDQGAQGAQGAAGSGAQGAQGFQGAVGSTGAQGAQGAVGSGAQGAQGLVGSTGAQGAQGGSGAVGASLNFTTSVVNAGIELSSSESSFINLGIIHRLKITSSASNSATIKIYADTAKTVLIYEATSFNPYDSPYYEDLIPFHFRNDDLDQKFNYKITNSSGVASTFTIQIWSLGA